MLKKNWLAPCAAFLATFVAFLPALKNGFVDFDDDSNFLLNPYYRGFAHWRWLLTNSHNGHYHPLTWLSLALDYKFWGMNPAGYHLTSLILHAFNAALFCLIARRLLARAGGLSGRELTLASLFAALLFGLHPLRVESVAWASERRDVLSGFFYLLTVLTYLIAQDEPASGRRWLGLSLAAYALSLLSKAIGVTLPAALLILDAYPLRRLNRKTLIEKIPYGLLGLVAAAIGFAAQIKNGAAQPFSHYGLAMRLAVPCYGLAFYLWKTLVPLNLVPIYPMPKPEPFTWAFNLSAAAVAAATTAFWLLRRRYPAALASWLFYAVTLLPVLGFVQYGPQLAADRYTYLSCLGWALLGGWALSRACRRLGTVGKTAAALLVAGLAALSWQQTQTWRDSWTLWSSAAKADPENPAAHLFLGNVLFRQGQIPDAAKQFQTALDLDPGFGYAAAHNNLGKALSALGRNGEAIPHFREALRASPEHPGGHYNLAEALAASGKTEEAAAEYRAELRINPGFDKAQAGLEKVLAAPVFLNRKIESKLQGPGRDS